MLEVGCASVVDRGNTEMRHRVLMNAEHWQGGNHEVYRSGGMLACEPCLG